MPDLQRFRQARFGRMPTLYDWSRTHARQRGGEAVAHLAEAEWPAASRASAASAGWSGVPVHDQHGMSGVRRDGGRDAAEENACETALAVGAERDQAGVAVVGDAGDSLPRWRFGELERLGAEAGGLCQRGSVRGGLLGSSSDLVACRS